MVMLGISFCRLKSTAIIVLIGVGVSSFLHGIINLMRSNDIINSSIGEALVKERTQKEMFLNNQQKKKTKTHKQTDVTTIPNRETTKNKKKYKSVTADATPKNSTIINEHNKASTGAAAVVRPKATTRLSKATMKKKESTISIQKTSKSSSSRLFEPDLVSKMRQNHFSGAYWASRDTVLKIKPDKIRVFAAASVELFQVANRVVMAKDWLDCSLEHWSKLPKHFIESKMSYKHDDKIFKRLVEIISSYVSRGGGDNGPSSSSSSSSQQLDGVENSPARETIAVLPLYEMEEPGQTKESFLSLIPNLEPRERVAVLIMYALTATIVSLWRVGMARVVVVGRTEGQPEMVKAAFHLVNEYINRNNRKGSASPMELAYVWGLSDMQQQSGVVIMPKLATEKIQAALRGVLGPSDARAFLGDNNDPSRFKYVYFTEPDLILHTRSSVFDEFREQLDNGNAIAPVRFQVMPHEVDFPKISPKNSRILLPAVGHFADFQDLDPDIHSCCDGGSYWPGMDDEQKCEHVRFYQCGFQKGAKYTEAEANVAHKRLLKYPMFRLKKTGLGIYLLQNHGRLCYPGKIGACG